MARRTFFSFHYTPDNWRVAQVRNMGMVAGNRPVSDSDWETVTKGGDAAIKEWIVGQMHGRSCTIVLVGSNTAFRKWIDYEIITSWNEKMGVVGPHTRLDDPGRQDGEKGQQPACPHQPPKRRKEAVVDREVLHAFWEEQPGTIRLGQETPGRCRRGGRLDPQPRIDVPEGEMAIRSTSSSVFSSRVRS